MEPVINVTDLDEGERFWSALSGLSPSGRHGDEGGEQYSSLEDSDGAMMTRGCYFNSSLATKRVGSEALILISGYRTSHSQCVRPKTSVESR